MTKIVVYARKEPTTDSVAIQHSCANEKDVQVYHDKECTRPYARFPWYYSNIPTRRNKYVTLDCFRYKLEWVQ